MGRKTGASLSKALSIRISENEMREMHDYCTKHDLSYSEYIRKLILTHLGLDNDLQAVHGIKIQ